MAKNKFLLVSLKDAEAKQLGQVITNETSRKLLDYLAEQDATETQISQELGIPLPTIHYNLKALTQAGLVVCEEFHYSPKGREVNHYRLANKYIIIAPGTTWGLKERLRSVLPMIPIVGGIALALEWISNQSILNMEMETARAPSGLLRESVISQAQFAKSAIESGSSEALSSGALSRAIPSPVVSSPPLPSPLSAPAAPSLPSMPLPDAGAVQTPSPEAMLTGHPSLSQPLSPAPFDGGWFSHPGLWLLAGAIIGVGIWLVVEYIRERRR